MLEGAVEPPGGHGWGRWEVARAWAWAHQHVRRCAGGCPKSSPSQRTIVASPSQQSLSVQSTPVGPADPSSDQLTFLVPVSCHHPSCLNPMNWPCHRMANTSSASNKQRHQVEDVIRRKRGWHRAEKHIETWSNTMLGHRHVGRQSRGEEEFPGIEPVRVRTGDRRIPTKPHCSTKGWSRPCTVQ